MRKTLIALATAGVLASGVAIAGNTNGHDLRLGGVRPGAVHAERHEDRWQTTGGTIDRRTSTSARRASGRGSSAA